MVLALPLYLHFEIFLFPIPCCLIGSILRRLFRFSRFDFSSVFKYSLTKTTEYIEMYPEKRDQLDLHVIKERSNENRYDGQNGLRELFDDLILMCSNGKQFNDANKGFQPWVLIDMMEKTVLDLQLIMLGACSSHSSATASSSASGCKSQISSQMSRASQDEDPFDDLPDENAATERGTMQSEFEMEEFTQEV